MAYGASRAEAAKNHRYAPSPRGGGLRLPLKKADAFFMGTRGGVTGGAHEFLADPRLHTHQALKCMWRIVKPSATLH